MDPLSCSLLDSFVICECAHTHTVLSMNHTSIPKSLNHLNLFPSRDTKTKEKTKKENSRGVTLCSYFWPQNTDYNTDYNPSYKSFEIYREIKTKFMHSRTCNKCFETLSLKQLCPITHIMTPFPTRLYKNHRQTTVMASTLLLWNRPIVHPLSKPCWNFHWA